MKNNIEILKSVLVTLNNVTVTGFADAERLIGCRDGIQAVLVDMTQKPKGGPNGE